MVKHGQVGEDFQDFEGSNQEFKIQVQLLIMKSFLKTLWSFPQTIDETS